MLGPCHPLGSHQREDQSKAHSEGDCGEVVIHDTCRPAVLPSSKGLQRRGVGEQSLCASLLGEVSFRGLSETWLQLCSSNTVLFFTFDLNSTG